MVHEQVKKIPFPNLIKIIYLSDKIDTSIMNVSRNQCHMTFVEECHGQLHKKLFANQLVSCQ